MKGKKVTDKGIKIIPLGGLEQIGMNITAFEYEDSIIVVDCGLSFPDDDMFRLGYYHIYYKDGSDERVEILWGENIGPKTQTSTGDKNTFEDDGRPSDFNYCKETIFTCDFEDMDDGRYYRFVIPTKKQVERVMPEIFDRYESDVMIAKIQIKN